jgi:hypothetical protein
MEERDHGRDMTRIKNTICNGANLSYYRAAGNTTRQIDNAIQLLFQGYIVRARDHYEAGHMVDANRRLFELIIDRLNLEHSSVMRRGKIRIDKAHLELELMDNSLIVPQPVRGQHLAQNQLANLELTWFERTLIKLFLKKIQRIIENWK